VPSKQIDGGGSLRTFLESKPLRLRRDVVESTIKEVSETGSGSVANVQLRTQDLKRLGLL